MKNHSRTHTEAVIMCTSIGVCGCMYIYTMLMYNFHQVLLLRWAFEWQAARSNAKVGDGGGRNNKPTQPQLGMSVNATQCLGVVNASKQLCKKCVCTHRKFIITGTCKLTNFTHAQYFFRTYPSWEEECTAQKRITEKKWHSTVVSVLNIWHCVFSLVSSSGTVKKCNLPAVLWVSCMIERHYGREFFYSPKNTVRPYKLF